MAAPRTHPDRHPQLVLVIGSPGAGKTTLAQDLSEITGAPLVEKDHISDPLFDRGMTGPEHKSLAYEVMGRITASLLRTCDRVIVEAPLKKQLRTWEPGQEHPFAQFEAIAKAAGGTLAVVHAQCSPETLRARMESRAHPRDEDKMATTESFRRFLDEEPIALDPAKVRGYGVANVNIPDRPSHEPGGGEVVV